MSENSDRTKWNKRNYEELKKTLSQFIPFIQLVKISREDFYDKVRAYKVIIYNYIYEKIKELEKYYYAKYKI